MAETLKFGKVFPLTSANISYEDSRDRLAKTFLFFEYISESFRETKLLPEFLLPNRLLFNSVKIKANGKLIQY